MMKRTKKHISVALAFLLFLSLTLGSIVYAEGLRVCKIVCVNSKTY